MIMIIMPGSGVAHLYSQNWEVDRGRRISEFDWGQAGLQSEFQDSQGYTEKPCLEKEKKITFSMIFTILH